MKTICLLFHFFGSVPTTDQNQARKGAEHTVLIAEKTMLVSDKENGQSLSGEQKTENSGPATHSALSAKADNMFVVLHHRPVMFPLQNFHSV